jgi:hypothetical protein
LRFAYLHIANPAAAALEKGLPTDARAERMLALSRQKYRGTLIIAGGFDHDHAEQIRRGRRHAAGRNPAVGAFLETDSHSSPSRSRIS